MIRELVHDPIFLAKKSLPATKDDVQTAQDLLETLIAHSDGCVGMAANMIGKLKCIIAFEDNDGYTVMFNPEIIGAKEPYYTQEGCLSLLGEPRRTKRYKSIKVKYQNADMQVRIKTYKDFTAQIIQHEVDHCNGILI